MNSTGRISLEVIAQTVRQERGYNAWISRRCQITEAISRLDPDRPDDGTTGFLAYNIEGKTRMKMKTGRFLTRKLELNSGFLCDAAIRRIAEIINNNLYPGVAVRLDSGEAIRDNYRKAVGGGSCMTGCDCDKVGLYVVNEHVYRQLIMQQNGDTARAMVVRLDCGRYYMDRVYASASYLVQTMREYAAVQGWYYRDSDGGVCCPDGAVMQDYEIMQVSGLEYEDGEVPYQDTFTIGTTLRGHLTIGHPRSGVDGEYDFQITEGTLAGADRYDCYDCGRRLSEEDCRSVGDYVFCERCYSENFFYCEYCDSDRDLSDSVYLEDTNDRYCAACAEAILTVCDDCGKCIKETTHTEDGNVCDSCLDAYCQCEECECFVKELINDKYCEECCTWKCCTWEDDIAECAAILDAPGQRYICELARYGLGWSRLTTSPRVCG